MRLQPLMIRASENLSQYYIVFSSIFAGSEPNSWQNWINTFSPQKLIANYPWLFSVSFFLPINISIHNLFSIFIRLIVLHIALNVHPSSPSTNEFYSLFCIFFFWTMYVRSTDRECLIEKMGFIEKEMEINNEISFSFFIC